jgi:CheY-like chemotaxis protein
MLEFLSKRFGTSHEPKAQGRRILVVDDNLDTANMLATLLRLHGNDVQTVHDGQAALEAVQAGPLDVVILDIGLPGMDGYEVARQMRRQPGGDQLLVVALTGWGEEEDRRRSKEAGFDHHLVKPVAIDVLKKLLARVDGGHQMNSDPSE